MTLVGLLSVLSDNFQPDTDYKVGDILDYYDGNETTRVRVVEIEKGSPGRASKIK